MNTKYRFRKSIAIIVSILIIVAALFALTLCVFASEDNPTGSTAPSGDIQNGDGIVLGTIGHYCPDTPAIWEIDPDETKYLVHNDVVKEIAGISEADWTLLHELEAGYLQKSVRDFREQLAAAIDASPTALESISSLAYAGMHDPFTTPNDFYTSLFFSLTEYYQNSGNPQVRDAFYMLGFYRYFGPLYDSYTEDTFDIMKTVALSYDIDIDYLDDSITVAQRNQAIADALGAVNRQLSALSFEEWQSPDIRTQLKGWIETALRENATAAMRFSLLSIHYGFTEPDIEA